MVAVRRQERDQDRGRDEHCSGRIKAVVVVLAGRRLANPREPRDTETRAEVEDPEDHAVDTAVGKDAVVAFDQEREHVELNQLLKLCGIVDSGGAGKALVASGAVRVDGAVELRKTCKIRAGQVVELAGMRIRIAGG